jgi:hypothetical protein
MRNLASQFFSRGWCRFERDPALLDWIDAALPAARACVDDPRHARWLRYQGTWFAGVNALPNDDRGAVGGSGPLGGDAVDFIGRELGLEGFVWDQAQVSVCYPGYPLPMAGESDALLRYRRDRDAAHVDGLLREGPGRRRHLREHHGFILGIPMVEFDPGASPFAIWEGSHEIMREVFRERFAALPPAAWGDEDVTDIYRQARERVFSDCRRIEIHARPGEAYLAHRLSLHGMAPWQEGANAGTDGRMIVYFRPDTFGPFEWLNDP